MQVDADVLVRDYISRLEAAARPLPMERRAELAAEVREHIETALAEAGRRDEVTIRNVLERLGPPEEIVAAETEPSGAPPSDDAAQPMRARAVQSPWGPVEIIALLLLTVGAVLLPFVGPILGLVFVWLSAQWTTRHKLIATGIVVAILLLPVLLTLNARSAT
jgi:uncharacterized membrane protein